jgi:gliding motility-associated-like protein
MTSPKPFYLRLLLLCCSFIAPAATNLFAQGQDNIWIFGDHHGLDFNSGAPVIVYNTPLASSESAASVCDENGNLLFYSNSESVWNRNGNVMPNGAGIIGYTSGGSTSQGTGIVQSIANPSQYYLFTMEDMAYQQYYNGTPTLRYSVIDMSLNGGLGDVMPGQKNIVLETHISEQMAILPLDNCEGYWLVVRNYSTQEYKAYKIDATGIHPPVASPHDPAMGVHLTQGLQSNGGEMKFNPAGTIIAWMNFQTHLMEMGTFDRNTGLISNRITINTTWWGPGTGNYGIEFSPDGSKFYLPGGSYYIRQYDASLYPNAAAIEASKIELIPNGGSNRKFMGTRLGPDGKIYINTSTINYADHTLTVINNPNATGNACNLVQDAILMPWTNGQSNSMGLKAAVRKQDIAYYTHNDAICAPLTMTAGANANSYTWNTGATTASIITATPGTYWVKSQSPCAVRIDTFHITRLNEAAANILGDDKAICPGANLTLNASTAGASYVWQDGSTQATFVASQPGQYIVQITKNGCTISDTVNIYNSSDYLSVLKSDTTICQSTSVSIPVETTLPEYQWDNGVVSAPLTVSAAGTYIVTANSPCGILKDTITVKTIDCDCVPMLPNAFTPNGDGRNDLFEAKARCAVKLVQMTVYNRYGQRIFESNGIKGWDGNFKGKKAETGVYCYYLTYTDQLGKTATLKGDVTLLR